MVLDINNVIYAQFGGQKLPRSTAISTVSSPAEARVVEKRRLENKKILARNLLVNNGFKRPRSAESWR
jgi:hypothetical protein